MHNEEINLGDIEKRLLVLLQKMNESNMAVTLEEVNTTFRVTLKNKPFHLISTALHLCAKVCANIPYIRCASDYAIVTTIINHYLTYNPHDRDLLTTFAQLGDDYCKQNTPNAWTVSHVFEDDSKQASKTTEEYKAVPIGRQVFKSDMSKKTISYQSLTRQFKKLEKKMCSNNKNIKANEFTTFVVAYCYQLKSDYPLNRIDGGLELIQIIEHLQFAISALAAVRTYLKQQVPLNYTELYRVVRCHAFLSRIFSEYYDMTSESETKKRAAKTSAAQSQLAVFNLNGISFCEHVSHSKTTSEHEKSAAEDLKKRFSKAFFLTPSVDYFEGVHLNEQWSHQTYQQLRTLFEQSKMMIPTPPLHQLYHSSSQYLYQMLFQYLGLYLMPCYIDSEMPGAEMISLNETYLSKQFPENRLCLLNALTIYFEIKQEYLKSFMASFDKLDDEVYLHNMTEAEQVYNTAENSNAQSIQNQIFQIKVKIDTYQYLLNPPVNDNPEVRLSNYLAMLNQRQETSPLIRSLIHYEKQCAENEKKARMKPLLEKIKVEQTEILDNLDTNKKDTSGAYEKRMKTKKSKKKEKQQKKMAEQDSINEIERMYQKKLPLSQQWNDNRQNIITACDQKSYDTMLSLINAQLDNLSSLTTAEKYDIYLLQGVGLQSMGQYAEATIAFNNAWANIAPSEDICLYYTQRENLMIYRAQLFFLKGEVDLQQVMISELKQFAMQYQTDCFYLLTNEIGCISSLRKAADRYAYMLEKITNKETNFLLNEYNLKYFFAFYQKLSQAYLQKGEHIFKSDSFSPEKYFEHSIAILEQLLGYAKAYDIPYIFELSIQFIHRCIEIYEIWPQNKTYLKKAVNFYNLFNAQDHGFLSDEQKKALHSVQININSKQIIDQKKNDFHDYINPIDKTILENLTVVDLQEKIASALKKQQLFFQIASLVELLNNKIIEKNMPCAILNLNSHNAFILRLNNINKTIMDNLSSYHTNLLEKCQNRVEYLQMLYEIQGTYLRRLVSLKQTYQQAAANNFNLAPIADLAREVDFQFYCATTIACEIQTNGLIAANKAPSELQELDTEYATIQGIPEKDQKGLLWLPLTKAFTALDDRNNKKICEDNILCLGSILDWLLYHMNKVCIHVIQTSEQYDGLQSFFEQAKVIASSYCNKKSQLGFFSGNLDLLNQRILDREIPPFEPLSTDLFNMKSGI